MNHFAVSNVETDVVRATAKVKDQVPWLRLAQRNPAGC